MSIDKDINLHGDEYYTVRSMYFDDYNSTFLKDVLNGVSRRFKFRIRIYNYDDSYILLEKKSKINNMTKKESCKITKEQVQNILNDSIIISDKNPKLLNELYVLIKTKRYKPVVIIDYDRIPYVYENLVRITIDKNTRCSYDVDKKKKKEDLLIPVVDENTSILEVKYGCVLPDVIKYGIQINSLYGTSYSKYANARLVLKDYIGGSL